MKLVSFLNTLFKHDGFELIDSNSKKYVIGKPSREKPIALKSVSYTHLTLPTKA